MDKDDDFLDAIEADNNAETQTEVTEAQPTPEAPQVVETPPAEPIAEAAPPVPEDVEPKQAQHVPLTALLDERDKRKQEQDRAAMLEDQLRRMTQSQQPQVQAPDPLEDPEGFAAFVSEQVQANSINTTLNMSEVNARQSFGDETVNAAQQWAKQRMSSDPYYSEKLRMSPHPYAMVVADYQRDSALQRLGDPKQVDEFLAWRAAQEQLAAPPVTPAAPPAAHQAPPKSLASAPSAGGVSSVVAETEEEIFDEVITGLN
jgi:hypothetical protein